MNIGCEDMDDMIKLYKEKRREYENKISTDLERIEKSVYDIAEIGDYFSIKNDDELITVKAIDYEDNKCIAIKTDTTGNFIPFKNLTLTDHPDLILWIIQNSALIKQGFTEVLINAVRNGENIINTLKELNINYK